MQRSTLQTSPPTLNQQGKEMKDEVVTNDVTAASKPQPLLIQIPIRWGWPNASGEQIEVKEKKIPLKNGGFLTVLESEVTQRP